MREDQQTTLAQAPAPQVSKAGFPADFAWGSATAAYQIEGAAREDGKGESIWDRFTHTPNTIAGGSTGDIACDHYHRWQEDLDLMARLSHNAYRFSIAWTRILPEGRGQFNEAGLDFYARLVEGLLARGITPFVTLYHWDLPQALQDRGGWENRDTANYFADYAQTVAQRLGDRVGHWITLNEPQVVVIEGFVRGTMAPGKRDVALIRPVAHHLLLGHGLAVQALRAETPHAAVGITLNFAHIEPATDREEDAATARFMDGLWHRTFLDPIYCSGYPEDIDTMLPAPDGLIREGDQANIHAPLDFLGANYYTRLIVRTGQGGVIDPQVVPPRGDLTAMGWDVYPEGLSQVLLRLRDEYHPLQLYITENGAAYPDTLTKDGAVHDPKRTAYLRDHLRVAQHAIAAGVPLHGYFAWSLMDNFEWAHGYVPRFGLLYTDYPTQRRIVKDSGHFFARMAATNGGALEEDG